MDLRAMKIHLKEWEVNFLKNNNRRPSGKDILTAPKETIDIYKKYKLLKKSNEVNNENVYLNKNNVWLKGLKEISTCEESSFFDVKALNKNIKHLRKSAISNENKTKRNDYKDEINMNANDEKCEVVFEKIQGDMLNTDCKKLKNNTDKLHFEFNKPNLLLSKDDDLNNSFCTSERNIEKSLSKINIHRSFSFESNFSKNEVIKNVDAEAGSEMEKDLCSTVTDLDVSNDKNVQENSLLIKYSKDTGICQSSLERKRNLSDVYEQCTPTKKLKTENYLKLNKKCRKYTNVAVRRNDFIRKSIRRNKWRNRLSNFGKCYRCGDEGHFANKCTKHPNFGPRDEYNNVNALGFLNCNTPKLTDFKFETLETVGKLVNRKSCFAESKTFESLAPLADDDITNCLNKSLKIFRFKSFRPYQEKIIRRICTFRSTLGVLPTGSGKSLCYQIPAHILHETKNAIALVISPLISLMQDQISKMPKKIKAVTLNSSMKYNVRKKLLEEIYSGEYCLVLISPEALVDSNIIEPEKLPPISFACIDEVHCLSDWSHHFRPSYLRVSKLLRDKFGVRCFLGLTATCKVSSLNKIANFLGIDKEKDFESIIRLSPVPDNILISASICKRSSDKEKRLIKLLHQYPYNECKSIIVYCSTREECNDVASTIRLSFDNSYSSANSMIAEEYHAGLDSKERRARQNRFMRGRIRVLVATVAFGMGLDKRDVRAVIHYSRPRTFENFVQEIGRAGRDGETSYSHVILLMRPGESLSTMETVNRDVDARIERHELDRYTYSNYVDPASLKKFVDKIFMYENKCVHQPCTGHINSIFPSEIAVELNIREETLMTILCYLELIPEDPRCTMRENRFFTFLPATYRRCTVSCYGGAKEMAEVSHKSLALAYVLGTKFITENKDVTLLEDFRTVDIDLIELWEQTGLAASCVRRELKSLQWKTVNCDIQKDNKDDGDRECYNEKSELHTQMRYFPTGVSTEFRQWCWAFAVRCDLEVKEKDQIYDYLYSRLNKLETSSIVDSDNLEQLLHANASTLVELKMIADDDSKLTARSVAIKDGLHEYFDKDQIESTESEFMELTAGKYDQNTEHDMRALIRSFVTNFRDIDCTPKSVVCVLYGINTPALPSNYWYNQTRFWKQGISVDFRTLLTWATEEIRLLKSTFEF